MKRIAIKLVVFLLLGAVVNVAVAWGCAWPHSISIDPLSPYQEFHDKRPVSQAILQRFTAAGWQPTPDEECVSYDVWYVDEKGRGLTTRHYFEDREFTLGCNISKFYPGLGSTLVEIESGWPFSSARREAWYISIPAIYPRTPSSDSGAQLGKYIVPAQPILPGFFINTLFYAVILWLLWSAPFATRRLIRKRRGKCVRCGYDLRGAEHEVCPECGA